jgi:hypothetical protein
MEVAALTILCVIFALLGAFFIGVLTGNILAAIGFVILEVAFVYAMINSILI